jgi:hypothetical protein
VVFGRSRGVGEGAYVPSFPPIFRKNIMVVLYMTAKNARFWACFFVALKMSLVFSWMLWRVSIGWNSWVKFGDIRSRPEENYHAI